MAARSSQSSGRRYAQVSNASADARRHRLRRAGWEPGELYPGVDEQSGWAPTPPPEESSAFTNEFTTEFS